MPAIMLQKHHIIMHLYWLIFKKQGKQKNAEKISKNLEENNKAKQYFQS